MDELDEISPGRFNLKKAMAKFWRFVEKGSGCWVWTGNRLSSGYGRFHFAKRTFRAHRFSYLINVGQVPFQKLVCHHCDNPVCVRPDHLFLGSDADNATDKAVKGRSTAGEQNYFYRNGSPGQSNGRAKLTEGQVREIRKRNAAGESQCSLAREFKVRQGLIWAIVKRKLWTHI